MNKQRFFAWILLAGFILLLVNIFLIHYMLQFSILIYLIVCLYFFLVLNRRK